jgi:hypothetical protein
MAATLSQRRTDNRAFSHHYRRMAKSIADFGFERESKPPAECPGAINLVDQVPLY